MGHGHPSRLVTLGQNLALLVEGATQAAVGLAGAAGALVRAPFAEPRLGRACRCQRCERCCYDPPVYRCGGW